MEPHLGIGDDVFAADLRTVSVEDLWTKALAYTISAHEDSLWHYREISLDDLTPHLFWSEYVWCVYASGFNAKVLTKKFKEIMNAYGPWDWTHPESAVSRRVLAVFRNKAKCKAVLRCRSIIATLGWEGFVEEYLCSVDTLSRLPFIGGITKYHLGRNLGFDCVKPDLHLVRLATLLEFDTPATLCAYLSGLSGERAGVVDFILWAWCASYGTKELA